MRKTTEIVVSAFLARQPKTSRNTKTNGQSLFLFDIRIAHWSVDGELEITTAGYDGPTTKDRLNALPGVHVYHKNKQLYLNGEKWDGGWTVIKH